MQIPLDPAQGSLVNTCVHVINTLSSVFSFCSRSTNDTAWTYPPPAYACVSLPSAHHYTRRHANLSTPPRSFTDITPSSFQTIFASYIHFLHRYDHSLRLVPHTRIAHASFLVWLIPLRSVVYKLYNHVLYSSVRIS